MHINISQNAGDDGELHSLAVPKDEILIFQLPRTTRMLSDGYVASAQSALQDALPKGIQALIIGCDVDIYSICGDEAVTLRLKGLI